MTIKANHDHPDGTMCGETCPALGDPRDWITGGADALRTYTPDYARKEVSAMSVESSAEVTFPDGDFTVIGPGCFAEPDGSVLNWRGVNYVPQRESLRVRFHNWRVGRKNRRIG